MQSLRYIGTTLIAGADTGVRIAGLVEVARKRNSDLGVSGSCSGSLLFTSRHFAQILEGKAQAINTLMHSVTVDSRHTDICVVESLPLAERRFNGLSLGYAARPGWPRTSSNARIRRAYLLVIVSCEG